MRTRSLRSRNGTKADILRAYPDVNPTQIHVIYNGIDLDEYQKTDETKALDGLWRRSGGSLCAVRGAHHAAEGRDAPGGRDPLPAA